MKSIPRYLTRLFSPKHLQNLDVLELLQALNNETIRKIWLYEVYQDLREMNLGVEKALLNGDMRLNDLSARRRAYQDVLEGILTAKKRQMEEKDHDHKVQSVIDLDRVTV